MDEEIELTTVDGQTVRVSLAHAVAAVGRAIQHDAYCVATDGGDMIEVRRTRADDDVPPEIAELHEEIMAAVDERVAAVLKLRKGA